jgi:hypothetical protein
LPGEFEGGIAGGGGDPGDGFTRGSDLWGRTGSRASRFERVVADVVEDFVARGAEVG